MKKRTYKKTACSPQAPSAPPKADGVSLPPGVKDFLPGEAEEIGRIEAAILSVFKKHGFKRVITPALEYADVLALGAGESLMSKVLKFIDPSTGRVMALRPDITPQVARLVATRMRDESLPLKLCYTENAIRYAGGARAKAREILQIGAEHISKEASPEIDAGMVVMAMESLKKAGIKNFKVDIGDVGFVRQALNGLKISEAARKNITELVAKKDSSGLSSLTKGMGKAISQRERDMLISLTQLYGEKEVVSKAASLVKDPSARAMLKYLKKVLDIICKKGFGKYVTIDLGEVRGFDYYTGMIFEAFSPGVGSPLLSGGRYDTLISNYGYKVKASGFAFDAENLISTAKGS